MSCDASLVTWQLSEDGSRLVIDTPSGERFELVIDERLQAAIRSDRVRVRQLEMDMDEVLTPREIQTRVRAGESVEQIAESAGVSAESIEPFAAPIVAERAHIAAMAAGATVRADGSPWNFQPLRSVADSWADDGEEPDLETDWDAYRTPEREWFVRIQFGADEVAEFAFDHARRSVSAHNEFSYVLLGLRDKPLEDTTPIVRSPDVHDEPADVPVAEPEPDDSDTSDDQFDSLYEMLSGINEDSVEIYEGLSAEPVRERKSRPKRARGKKRPKHKEPAPEPVSRPTRA
ncbi:MAG: hypothetical protein CR980_01135, partial [Propionibacteriales bacterium]